MQVICNTEDFQITEKTAVTLGKFDGIHKGHQRLLNALLEKKKQGLKTVVFTFFVPPIPGREDVRQLTPNDEKKKFLEAYGIDYLIEYPFTEKVRHTAPKDFIREILFKKLCAAFVAAGPDFCFGYERKGNVALLEKMSSLCGYEFEVFDKVSYKGEPISSSRIRACISEGQMEDACEMLDRPFSLSGTVIHGKAIGHTIGFATMNLVWPEDKLLVPIGVYLSKVKIEPLFEEFVDFETFAKSDFRVVKIESCEAVEKSKKLLKFTLNDGTERKRTILSGIHTYYTPEELVGKTCVAITNLPTRMMMGIPSEGMLISAVYEYDGHEGLNLLMLDDAIPAGAKLY